MRWIHKPPSSRCSLGLNLIPWSWPRSWRSFQHRFLKLLKSSIDAQYTHRGNERAKMLLLLQGVRIRESWGKTTGNFHHQSSRAKCKQADKAMRKQLIIIVVWQKARGKMLSLPPRSPSSAPDRFVQWPPNEHHGYSHIKVYTLSDESKELLPETQKLFPYMCCIHGNSHSVVLQLRTVS